MTKSSRQLVFWVAVVLFFFIFVYLVRSILLPFIVGMATAYFLDPAADRMQRWGLSRTSATTLITVTFFLLILLVVMLIVPVLFNQLSQLMYALPGYIHRFEEEVLPSISNWAGGLPQEYVGNFKTYAGNLSGVLIRVVGDFLTNMLSSGVALVNMISLLLITPVVAFYLLRDWDRVVENVDGLLPRKQAPVIREQLVIINRTLAGFVHGQLNVCLLLAIYYAIGLSIAGLNFGIIIGIATGFLVILPYVGLFFGMAVGLGVAFFQFQDLTSMLVVLGVFMSGQVLEGNFVTPKLVGDKVGLHPAWIIFAILAGAALFGFVGVLIAVPVAAVIGVLIRFALRRYVHSAYYTG